MAISRADFWSFIIEFTTRNPNLGIPALEDRLFANLLIFDYLYNDGNSRKGPPQGCIGVYMAIYMDIYIYLRQKKQLIWGLVSLVIKKSAYFGSCKSSN